MAKPTIRFRGFDDEWEQRKLGEVFEQTSNLVNPKEDEIELWSLTVEDGLTKKSDRYNREFLVKKDDNFKEVRPGDIVYNPMNMTLGAVGYNGMAKSVAVSGYYTTMVTKENYDTYYINTWLKSPQAIQLYRTYATGSLIEKQRVQFPTLSIIPVAFPKYEEQTKIGSYFDSLDNLITLHQRKCDETKKLKKYMLQKMFPQNGSKVPEIRFKGFTDEWEQRKLGDIAEFSKGSGYSKGDLIESGTPIILYGRLYTKYETSISEVDTYVEAKDGSVYSKGGEVIVPASGETAEDIARAATVDKSGVILGGDLNVVSPNEDINSLFLAISISHGNSQRELAKKAQGKSVVHIHNEEIKNLVVPFPAKAEQNKIVEYFSNFDNLITLHQHKCEELKKLKKFMLQNMFA